MSFVTLTHKRSAHACRSRTLGRMHSQQKGKFESDGSYLLEIPYSDDRELLMDILRHGSEVEVIAPEKLRERIRKELERAFKFY